jgi:hypothetical protein
MSKKDTKADIEKHIATVEFVRRYPYTYARVVTMWPLPNGCTVERVGHGFSKYRAEDADLPGCAWSPERGQVIAFGKAIVDLARELRDDGTPYTQPPAAVQKRIERAAKKASEAPPPALVQIRNLLNYLGGLTPFEKKVNDRYHQMVVYGKK